MNEERDIRIRASWYASDLAGYGADSVISVLSRHGKVMNMLVEGLPHLLAISSPALYKGPATIGLSFEDFDYCKSNIRGFFKGMFRPGTIDIQGEEYHLVIDWSNSPCLSFAPPLLPSYDASGILRSLEHFHSLLFQVNGLAASAVVLGIERGEVYFRKEISQSLPSLVDALIQGDQKKFALNCQRLVGLGRGSTPTGDDLIHGALLACHYYFHSRQIAWDPPSYPKALSHSTNLMGAHMLDMAQKGLTAEPVRNLLCEIFAGCLHEQSVNQLLCMGSSTGRDLAVAILYTLDRLLEVIG